MEIGNFKIKPVMIFLPDEQIWMEQHQKAKIYLKEQGIHDCEYVAGIHGEKWGVIATNTPEQFTHPDVGKTGGFLSYYILWNVLNYMPDQYFFVLENDVNFVNNWKIELEKALNACSDFDFMFVGSCCTEGKYPIKIGNSNVYEFPFRKDQKYHMHWYPQCGHAFIVNKKCVPHLIRTQRDVSNPHDVSLANFSFPNMKVVAILPRLADQLNTAIPN